MHPLPSTASIERVLHDAEMTHPRQIQHEEEKVYPRLQAMEPGQLRQVDIVPHYLRGGDSVACFNAIDVVSRYPADQAHAHRSAVTPRPFWSTSGSKSAFLNTPKWTTKPASECDGE